MQKYIELLRKPMQVKPESLRAARQKSSSTPPHVYRLNYNESPYGLGPLSEEALEKAIKNNIHVINVTQCSGGSVSMGNYETSTQLKNIGVVSGKDITTEAAITKLMYLLGQKVSNNVLKTIFETAIRGEMT